MVMKGILLTLSTTLFCICILISVEKCIHGWGYGRVGSNRKTLVFSLLGIAVGVLAFWRFYWCFAMYQLELV